MVMQEGNDKMTDLMIDWLIYRWMYESDRAWKTVADVRKGLKDLNYNKDKMAGLRDNTQIMHLDIVPQTRHFFLVVLEILHPLSHSRDGLPGPIQFIHPSVNQPIDH